jgi:hypothetical protein
MDVKMPDGTIIQNVPEGTTQSQLNARFSKYQATQSQPAAPTQPERTFAQDMGRQAGLAGRAVINAVAGIPMMAMDAGVGARNLITGSDYEAPSKMFSDALDSVGLPKPETRLEKIANFAETVLAGSRLPAPQASSQAPANFVKADPTAMVKAQTLNEAQKAGYVVPPATTNPTLANQALEGASGKIATAQAAAVRNQTVTNKLARQAVGLANDAPITPEALKSLRSTAGEVYNQVASSGKIKVDEQYLNDLAQLGKGVDEIAKDFPEANVGARQQIDKLVNSLLRDTFDSSSALKYLRQLRADAAGNLTSAARGGDPEKQALGMAQREAAATLEDLIGRHLAENGQPELAQSFEQARRLIATSHTIENALNEATGNVSAAKLASQLKGKPYGGELQVAAKFAQAFPKAAKEVNESMPGISPLDYYGSVGAAGLFHSPHLLMLPAARMAIREALLSPFGQKAAQQTAKAAGEAPQTLGLAGGTALATSTQLRQ